jgi:hypothetical protein
MNLRKWVLLLLLISFLPGINQAQNQIPVDFGKKLNHPRILLLKGEEAQIIAINCRPSGLEKDASCHIK